MNLPEFIQTYISKTLNTERLEEIAAQPLKSVASEELRSLVALPGPAHDLAHLTGMLQQHSMKWLHGSCLPFVTETWSLAAPLWCGTSLMAPRWSVRGTIW